ncbi:MAG: metallophosphoesterase [Paracoccaceae bacterium]
MRFVDRLRAARFDAPLAPDAPFWAIGDVHGRYDLLAPMLERIADDAPGQVICVGDYIDRGDASAQVLRHLAGAPDIIALMGNHEDMLVNFLDHPASGNRWLRHGGLDAVQSFGITDVSDLMSDAALHDLRDALLAAMGDDLVNWLRGLPRQWRSGNVAVVHAGADPGLPMDAQSARVLTWGHPEFAKHPRRDGIWVVHGHTIVDAAHQVAGRVAIDTGAYATGTLTAAHISAEGIRFITT